MKRTVLSFASALLALAPATVLAHPGHGHHYAEHWATTLWSGFLHPLLGVEHLVTMVAVGAWVSQLDKPRRAVALVGFLVVMGLAAGLGRVGIGLPAVEQGIVGSLILVGLLLASAVKLPFSVGVVTLGAFALFHGIAHGAYMPAEATAATYGVGFLMATALLQLVGIALGQTMANAKNAVTWQRTLGGLVAALGVLFLVS
jgi:urease accessory protein